MEQGWLTHVVRRVSQGDSGLREEGGAYLLTPCHCLGLTGTQLLFRNCVGHFCPDNPRGTDFCFLQAIWKVIKERPDLGGALILRQEVLCGRAAVCLGVPEAVGTLRMMQRVFRRRGTCVGNSSR
jgi:hypothetical protein